MANKKNKKHAASKETTQHQNETLQEAETIKGTSMDLVKSLDKMMANVDASVTQLGNLVNSYLKKLEALEPLRVELKELKTDFKDTIEVIRLEMQDTIEREVVKLREEVDNKLQELYTNFAEMKAKENDNKTKPEACLGSIQLQKFNTLQQKEKTKSKHRKRGVMNNGKTSQRNSKPRTESKKRLQLVNMVVNGRPVKALVDTGARHNFISIDEAIRLGVRVTKQNMMMKATNGRIQPILGMAYGVKATIGKWKGKIDLFVVPMEDHNFVIGQDFLDKESAFPMPFANKFCIMIEDHLHTVKMESDPRQGMALTSMRLEFGSKRCIDTSSSPRPSITTIKEMKTSVSCKHDEDVVDLGGGECHDPPKISSNVPATWPGKSDFQDKKHHERSRDFHRKYPRY